jgi:hypothetical protein
MQPVIQNTGRTPFSGRRKKSHEALANIVNIPGNKPADAGSLGTFGVP